MATIREIKQKIENANALGVANLTEKGVEISEDATTYEIMQNIAQISTGEADTFYNDFWDNYQENGNKTDYSYAFNGKGWNNVSFNPKYNIVPTKSNTGMFSANGFSGSLIELFEKQGIILDTSSSTGFQNMFLSATAITDIPELIIYNDGKAVSMAGAFGTCLKLEKVSIDIQSSVSSWVNTFSTCPELKELNLKGSIDINGFDVHWSTRLNKESLTGIINALSSATEGLTVTLSLTAVNTAFETSEGAGNGASSDEWSKLIATKANWTVELQ